MTRAVRYAIERTDRPESAARFLGHDNDGRIIWMGSFTVSNHFSTRRAAADIIEHRLRGAEGTAKVVRHSLH